jgi:hypothetical protein
MVILEEQHLILHSILQQEVLIFLQEI